MFIRLVTLVLIFTSIQFLTSCSSIISGTTQSITVNSNVRGADVIINGAVVGHTPITTRVKRQSKMHLIVQKDGYETYQASLFTKVDPWFWANIFIYGVLGSTTDYATGATHLLDPDNVYVELLKSNGSSASSDDDYDDDEPKPIKKRRKKKSKPSSDEFLR